MLTTIKLYGKLGKKYIKEIKLDVNSIPEIIRALSANFPGFREDVYNGTFNIYRDYTDLSEEDLLFNFSNKTIRIVPTVSGNKSAGSKVVIGIILIAASYGLGAYYAGLAEAGSISTEAASLASFASSAGTAIGTSLLLAGVTEMLFKPPNAKDKENGLTSSLFNGPVNTSLQGVPVPIGYGEVVTGSVVASFSIDNRNSTL